MQDLQEVYARQKKLVIYLLAFCALGWGFTPFQSVFAGLSLGALFGLYNFWILVRRLEKFDRYIDEGKTVRSLGTAIRFASGIAAVAVAMSLSEHIHLISTVIGLMIPYAYLLVDRIVYHVKHY
ncbi:ATP synthase subunit I [Paenisporosarcina sp. TG20]|uniref:ATP synthase subunit I n=1 Tax=Paenisporosarcina sp. TG20 TaxID=1211706 RepID=UPI0002D64941|nr:ATP synthase subunit I [Paenisporosarcina sp. TG20]